MFAFRISLLALFASTALLAQTASVTGRITDASGAVVPGAEVTARSEASGVATATATNDEGYYSLPSLLPGTYTLEVAKAGFAAYRSTGLTLTVQQVARLDLTLKVGSTTETVEVSAQAVLLESENATLGQVISNRQVTELPLLGRNSYALAMLVPGVRASAGTNNLVIDQISTVAYSINGQRSNANEFLLDGAPNSAPAQNQPVINANPDMVQEFKVETNSYAAEFGRAAGGVFNVVTRSGTNELHGTAYEFFRNDKLNANDWFANRAGTDRAPFRFNQFGGTLGGPVALPKLYDGRNRTFFFVNTELVRFVQGITFTAILPDPRQLAGDFSQARAANGQLLTIYDPATTRQVNGVFVRTPFPGNVIPSDRIDPVARNIARLFPAPTVANAAPGAVNYTRTGGNVVNKDSYSARLDHSLSERNRLFGRYSYDDTPFLRAPVYGPDFATVSPTAGPQVFTRWNTVVEDTHLFSPTLLGTFRYSATRLINERRPLSDDFDVTTLGLPASFRTGVREPQSLPAILIAGYSASSSIPNIVVGGLIGSSDLIRFGTLTHAAQGSLTKSLTSHTVKFGGEHRVIAFNNLQTGDTSTNFSFNQAFTQGPTATQSTPTGGSSLASFLLGLPNGGGVNPAPALSLTSKYTGFFVQDSWKATTRLTVNYGLRWEYESPVTDRFNQLANFDYNAASPVRAGGLALRGGLTYVGVGDLPRGNVNADRNNWGPRLGIAYRLAARTVVRTGAGLFYGTRFGIGGGGGPFGTSGFQTATNVLTSLDGVTPIFRFSDPYPNGFNQPTGSSEGLRTLLGQSVSFTDRGNVTPSSAQWNLNVQQELPGSIVFEVGYAGSRGYGQGENRQWNQLPDEALRLGNALRDQVENPFFGQVTVGALAQRTVTRAQLLRPFPQFDAVTAQQSSWASSTFHALESKLEKRYSRGLSVLVSYTWSKLMDYGTGPFAGEALGSGAIQNWNNLAAEWSPSTLDQTHRFIANAVYELPFRRSGQGALGKLLGGWQVAGIYSAFSGGPLGIGSAVNNTFSQGGGQRPNWTGVSATLDAPTPQRWFDTTQFSNPPAYTFGNVGRTLNGLRSDGTGQLDATLTKNTRFGERLNVQFRAEAFNVTNTPRFSPPNTTFGNANFGVVTTQNNLPRIVQFGLKLVF